MWPSTYINRFVYNFQQFNIKLTYTYLKEGARSLKNELQLRETCRNIPYINNEYKKYIACTTIEISLKVPSISDDKSTIPHEHCWMILGTYSLLYARSSLESIISAKPQ